MKTKLVIFALVTLFLMVSFWISSFAYSNEAIPAGELVTDRDDLIPDADEAEISEALRSAKDKCGTDIRVYVYRGMEYYDWSYYLDDSDENFDSLVLLVIQYDTWDSTYYYYLDTYGEAQYDISDTEVDRILDNPEVYNNIKSGNLKSGIIACADLAATAVSVHLRPNFVKVLIISLIIAAVVAVAVALSIYFSYKKKLHSESYPLERYASLDLRIERDSFITKFITRVRIRSSNGGGGGRSGGGRSGGGGSRRGGR